MFSRLSLRLPSGGPFIAKKFTEFVISILSGNISINNTNGLFQEFDRWKNGATLSIDFSIVINKIAPATETRFENNMKDFTVSTSKGKILENIHSIFLGRTFKATCATINKGVSQVHAFLCIIDNKLIIVDLCSKNGTKITVDDSMIDDNNFYHVIELNSDNVDIKIDTCNGIPLCHISMHDKEIVIY